MFKPWADVRPIPLGILARVSVKRHTWADFKACTKPEIRTRIETEASRLSDGIKSEASPEETSLQGVGRGDLPKPARDVD